MRPAGGRLSRSPSFLRLTRWVVAHPFLFSVGACEAVEEEEKGVGLSDGTMWGESLPHPSRRSNPMATSTSKLVLNGARDIPFNKLVPSAANVRKVKAGVSLEELAEDIGRRGLIQSLHVRPVLDGAGAETGLFEVTAGGRRLQALQRLVKAKRLSQDARGALRGANRPRHGRRGRLARRERPARAVASAGPVSRVPDVARGARDVG